MRRTLIVGAGYAGLLAAQRLFQKTRGAMEIVLVNPRPYLVERVRLHEDAAGFGPVRVPLEKRLAGTGIVFCEGSVRAIGFGSRRATIEGAGGTKDEAFDDLVLASGSIVSNGPPGAVRFAHAIATEEDALALRRAVDESPSARVVVCGGGLTGVELATELAERRRTKVTLVTDGEVVPSLGDDARSHTRHAFDRLGVERREGVRVAAVERDGVVLGSGEVIPSDITVWAGGFRASPLAKLLGLAVGSDGRALVDDRLRSVSHSFVHVAGDAASTPLRMACATACPMGAFVADDIVREIEGREPVPFSYGSFGTCLSLGRRDGVIQYADPLDRPEWVAFRGRTAAYFKELICRFAMHASTLERRGFRYRWRRGPALLASEETPLLRAS